MLINLVIKYTYKKINKRDVYWELAVLGIVRFISFIFEIFHHIASHTGCNDGDGGGWMTSKRKSNVSRVSHLFKEIGTLNKYRT